jgi:hypothetical protein
MGERAKAGEARPGDRSGNPKNLEDAVVEVTSPVCHAGAADDAYMGYLDRESLITELNTLLEAERAGAKVAAQLVADAARPELKALARVIQRDEVHWCKMLMGALQELGATPSKAVGGFYDQATAIPDVVARLAFVNRGQAWVVRRLKTLLPKVRADGLHADLLAMLAAHDHNITQAESTLARLPKADAQPGARAPQPES